jgi:hypothetical protein
MKPHVIRPLFVSLAIVVVVPMGLLAWKWPHLWVKAWLPEFKRIPVSRRTMSESDIVPVQCGCIQLNLPTGLSQSTRIEAIHNYDSYLEGKAHLERVARGEEIQNPPKTKVVSFRVYAPQVNMTIIRPVSLGNEYSQAVKSIEPDPTKSVVEIKAEQYGLSSDDFSWLMSCQEVVDFRRRVIIALGLRLPHAAEVEVLSSELRECLLVWIDETADVPFWADFIDHDTGMTLVVNGNRIDGGLDREAVRILLMSVKIAPLGTPCREPEPAPAN